MLFYVFYEVGVSCKVFFKVDIRFLYLILLVFSLSAPPPISLRESESCGALFCFCFAYVFCLFSLVCRVYPPGCPSLAGVSSPLCTRFARAPGNTQFAMFVAVLSTRSFYPITCSVCFATLRQPLSSYPSRTLFRK